MNFLSRKPYCSCTGKSMCLSTHRAPQAPLPRPVSKLLWRPFHLTAGESFPTDAERSLPLLHMHFNIHHPLGWTELRLKEVFFPAVWQRDFCCQQQMWNKSAGCAKQGTALGSLDSNGRESRETLRATGWVKRIYTQDKANTQCSIIC